VPGAEAATVLPFRSAIFWMLKKNGLSVKDVKVVNLEPQAAANAFVAGNADLDAGMTYEPYLSTVRAKPEAGKIIATTLDYPMVMDTFGCTPKFLAEGFGAAIAIALAADASVFSQYWDKLLSDAVSVQFIPTLGGALRRVFGPAWLQLLPMAMGILWLLLHYRSHHEHWDWHEQAPILLLASVLCTPYAFLIDEVVLLPVFLHAAARMRKTGPHRWILGGAYLALNALIFGMLVSGLRVVSLSYVWTPATWLLLYLVARRGAAESKVRAAAASNI
jgi:hypothetical protein